MKHPRRPRWPADNLSYLKAVSKIEPFSQGELMRLELPIRLSFDALKSGKGTEQDFHDLCAAINTAMVRSEEIDPRCEEVAIDARDALMRVHERFERVGQWGFDGPGLLAVESGIELHEQLIRLSTPLQMISALREVVRRGHAQAAA